MATRFTSSTYHLGSQVKLSTAKKIHPEMGGWFLEAYSVMTNFRTKVTNSIAKGTNSIAKWTNSIVKVTNSFAKGTDSIAKVTNSIAKTCNRAAYTLHYMCIVLPTGLRQNTKHQDRYLGTAQQYTKVFGYIKIVCMNATKLSCTWVKQMSNAHCVHRLHVGIEYTCQKFSSIWVSMHQSAALNCVRGEYHHVMHCIQAED